MVALSVNEKYFLVVLFCWRVSIFLSFCFPGESVFSGCSVLLESQYCLGVLMFLESHYFLESHGRHESFVTFSGDLLLL